MVNTEEVISGTKRPWGVILIFVLMIIRIGNQLFTLFFLSGIVLFSYGMGGGLDFDLGEALLLGLAIFIAFEIFVTIKLFTGKNWARRVFIVFVSIIFLYGLLSLIIPRFNILSLITNLSLEGIDFPKLSFSVYIQNIAYLGVEVFIVLYLFFNKKAKEFFKK